MSADLYPDVWRARPKLFETMAAEHNLAFDWDGYRQAEMQSATARPRARPFRAP